MNKPAVTKAQLTRAVETLEAMGKIVGGVEVRPDGSVRVVIVEALTPVEPAVVDASVSAELEAFGRAHGYG